MDVAFSQDRFSAEVAQELVATTIMIDAVLMVIQSLKHFQRFPVTRMSSVFGYQIMDVVHRPQLLILH